MNKTEVRRGGLVANVTLSRGSSVSFHCQANLNLLSKKKKKKLTLTLLYIKLVT